MGPAKAKLIAEWSGGTDEYEVQFNPTELSFDKQVQLAEIGIPGLDAPLQQFIRGQAEKLSIELFFDSTEEGMGAGARSVTEKTDKIFQLIRIDPKRHAPPIVTFKWSSHFSGDTLGPQTAAQCRHSFRGVIESLRQKFTLFSSEGVPLRATLNLVLREFRELHTHDKWPGQIEQLNLSSPDRSHSHVVSGGETLSSIAEALWKRPEEWRRIADANGIEDPRRLVPGTFLLIPVMQEG
jgi:nucleoid-associated protein YgaU